MPCARAGPGGSSFRSPPPERRVDTTGRDAAGWEQTLARNIVSSKYQRLVTAPITVSSEEVLEEYKSRNEKVKADYFVLDTEALSAAVEMDAIAVWENARETLSAIGQWNRMFADNADLIALARTADEIEAIHASGRTAVVFGFQNASPLEDDIDLERAISDPEDRRKVIEHLKAEAAA